MDLPGDFLQFAGFLNGAVFDLVPELHRQPQRAPNQAILLEYFLLETIVVELLENLVVLLLGHAIEVDLNRGQILRNELSHTHELKLDGDQLLELFEMLF